MGDAGIRAERAIELDYLADDIEATLNRMDGKGDADPFPQDGPRLKEDERHRHGYVEIVLYARERAQYLRDW